MSKTTSSVSVVIPVYNGVKYLSEAIESVLAQTTQPMEVIVVDDGSSDGTAEISRQYSLHIRYIYQSNAGAGAARNRGVELARGKFIAFLDADDLWVAEKLSLQLAAFEKNPALDMAFGTVRQFHSPELDRKTRGQIDLAIETMPGYVPGTMLVLKESFERVGGFNPAWKLAEFIDWHARAVDLKLKSVMLSEVVLMRRWHTTNQGVYKAGYRAEYARVLKAALDRRRKGNDARSQAE